MILVTLGTQDKQFDRLLIKLEELKVNEIIQDEIVVQAGHTIFRSDNMDIFDFIPFDKFNELVSTCDILVTHGGVGSIVQGLKSNKKIIAVPRLKEYGEHTNNHQIEIIRKYDELGYIIGNSNLDELGNDIIRVKTFKPNKFKSNNKNFIHKLDEEISTLLK